MGWDNYDGIKTVIYSTNMDKFNHYIDRLGIMPSLMLGLSVTQTSQNYMDGISVVHTLKFVVCLIILKYLGQSKQASKYYKLVTDED